MRLFEHVDKNQFKMVKVIKEAFNPSRPFAFLNTPPGTQVIDVKTLPVTLNDLLSPRTKYLAGNDPEGRAYIEELKKTSKIEAARKIPGFGGPDLHQTNNPNDYIYEVVTSYTNPEDGQRWSMLFGVSADGKTIQVFQS